MKCSYCGKEFEAKRSTAKFCSTSCKLKSARKPVDVIDLLLPPDEFVKLVETKMTEVAIKTVKAVDSAKLDANGYLNDVEAHKFFKVMDGEHQARVLNLIGCCRITKGEAIAQIIENDEEDALS